MAEGGGLALEERSAKANSDSGQQNVRRIILLTEATAPGAAAKTAMTAVAVTKWSFIDLLLLACMLLMLCVMLCKVYGTSQGSDRPKQAFAHLHGKQDHNVGKQEEDQAL